MIVHRVTDPNNVVRIVNALVIVPDFPIFVDTCFVLFGFVWSNCNL